MSCMRPDPQPSPTHEATAPQSPAPKPPAPPATAPSPMCDDELLEYRRCLATVLSQALAFHDPDQFIHGVTEDITRCEEELGLRGLSFSA